MEITITWITTDDTVIIIIAIYVVYTRRLTFINAQTWELPVL